LERHRRHDVLVDPKEGLFVVFMMQSPSQRTRYRTMLHNVVYGAFERAGE
jgi:hypothetical protein